MHACKLPSRLRFRFYKDININNQNVIRSSSMWRCFAIADLVNHHMKNSIIKKLLHKCWLLTLAGSAPKYALQCQYKYIKYILSNSGVPGWVLGMKIPKPELRINPENFHLYITYQQVCQQGKNWFQLIRWGRHILQL